MLCCPFPRPSLAFTPRAMTARARRERFALAYAGHHPSRHRCERQCYGMLPVAGGSVFPRFRLRERH
jgi:hypothetical protein